MIDRWTQWSRAGSVVLVSERLRVQRSYDMVHLQATASKLLTYITETNLASYPQRDWK